MKVVRGILLILVLLLCCIKWDADAAELEDMSREELIETIQVLQQVVTVTIPRQELEIALSAARRSMCEMELHVLRETIRSQ